MFEGMLKYAQTVADNIERINEINIKKATGKMIDANEDQLDKGILTSGSPIKPDYTPNYATKKGFKTPNLKVKGDWRKSIYVNNDLTFGASDYKTPFLVGKYSDKILGNTEKNAGLIFDQEIYKKDNEYIAKQQNRFL